MGANRGPDFFAHMADDFVCFLFDNGSFRADSTRSLRRLAMRVGERLGFAVKAVSLLHSTRVPAEELDGERAQLLEPALDAWMAEHPRGRALLLPLFFGPSGALVEYLPERLAALKLKHPDARVWLAEALVLPDEPPVELAAALADRVKETAAGRGWCRPKVILCDHGTPLPSVTAVRNRLGELLAAELADKAEAVAVASMERRPGDEYAFNEPLLATRLATEPFAEGEVIVALQFLSPGRHAGPGGDVAEICEAAEAAATAAGKVLHTAMTATLADDARVADVLARRAKAGMERLSAL